MSACHSMSACHRHSYNQSWQYMSRLHKLRANSAIPAGKDNNGNSASITSCALTTAGTAAKVLVARNEAMEDKNRQSHLLGGT